MNQSSIAWPRPTPYLHIEKKKKKKKSINQEKCYPTKAITATEDFFSFTGTKDDGILKWLT